MVLNIFLSNFGFFKELILMLGINVVEKKCFLVKSKTILESRNKVEVSEKKT